MRTKPIRSYMRVERRVRHGRSLLRPDLISRRARRLVRAQLGVALPERREQLDDRLADVLLELPVARAVVARLDLGDRRACRDGRISIRFATPASSPGRG